MTAFFEKAMLAPRHTCRCGLSRVDITLAIVLLGVAFSLFMIAIGRLQSERRGEGEIGRRNCLKQLAHACHSYQDVFKKLPPAFDKRDLEFAASVHVHLLPFVEQDNLFKMMRVAGNADVGDGFVSPPFLTWTDPSLSWTTPSHDGKGIQNFAANLRVFSHKGVNSPWDWDLPALARIEPGSASIPATFSNGAENTVVFATKFAACGAGGSRFKAAPDSPFGAFFGQNAATVPAHPSHPGATFQLFPGAAECRHSPLMPQSFSNTSLEVALADGSVRSLSPRIRPRIWNLLLQPNHGQSRGDEWE